MADKLEPKAVDKRTWERYVRMGLLDEREYERHLKSLPDLGEKSATVDTQMFEDDDIDDDSQE